MAAAAPAIAVALLLRAFASRKALGFCSSLAAAAVGGFLSPSVLRSFSSYLDAYLMQVQYAAPVVAAGALLFGGIALLGDYLERPPGAREA